MPISLSRMQYNPIIQMAKTTSIIRRSIYAFLQNYQYFTTTAAFLAFPYAASILLSQAVVPSSSSLLPAIYHRIETLFHAAGIPPSSLFFNILNLKISQTISSSILTLPFTLTFFLIAKASIIQAFNNPKSTLPPSSFSIFSIFNPLFVTHMLNSFLILSTNATAFSILFFAFNFLEGFGFSSPNFLLIISAAGAVFYSVALANTLIICNLALVLSGMEKSGGYLAILKSCVLIRGRTSQALSLAVPVNLALAAIEALFQYRVVTAYHVAGSTSYSMALEGMLITYLYSIFVVLDTVVSCLFFKSCKSGSCIDQEDENSYSIEIEDEDPGNYASLKNSEQLP
ncbi:hypothetical protein CFOL_v3_15038 [Cephalotus follicularis]|uniref:Transmembrane protein n=1 Tax=Cephalotus follicularis TaxID=3775 RepID=A0A1Q3BU92_CEPFO|nr:hypothetical protein CFOL_v3_15038 [Cephalotus follicularis]